MKVEDLTYWGINATGNIEIMCSECGQWSNCELWEEASVYCELCGSHDAIECPKCGELFDHTLQYNFKIKQIAE